MTAQSRAHTRLIGEHRDRFRRIYADATGETRGRRRGSAITQLVSEYPERYQEIYTEEAKKEPGSDRSSVNPHLIGSASGPGPWHAVLTDGSATVCGRTRFHTYPASDARRVTCSYCIDKLYEKPAQSVDPRFGEHASCAQARVREFADLRKCAATARIAALEALASLRTPPKGTAERTAFVEVLSEAYGAGLTLEEIGKPMDLSRERIRQLLIEIGSAS